MVVKNIKSTALDDNKDIVERMPDCVRLLRDTAVASMAPTAAWRYGLHLRSTWIEQFNGSRSASDRALINTVLMDIFSAQVDLLCESRRGKVQLRAIDSTVGMLPKHPIVIPIMVGGYNEGLRIVADLRMSEKDHDILLMGSTRKSVSDGRPYSLLGNIYTTTSLPDSRYGGFTPETVYIHEWDRKFLESNRGRPILLVDDMCETGGTARILASYLLRAGHEEIFLFPREFSIMPEDFSLSAVLGPDPDGRTLIGPRQLWRLTRR
jgi:hypothetical protein